MLPPDIRPKVDALWNAFWTGGISNPLEVIEQITYLLFLRRLDSGGWISNRERRWVRFPC